MASDPKPVFASISPYPEETLLSIIARTAEVNVQPSLIAALAAAGIDTHAPAFVPFSRVSESGRLAARLGLDQDYVRNRMHPSSRADFYEAIDWYGTPVPRRFVDAETYRFSPKSLITGTFQRATWMLRPLLYCAESLELLVSRCPHCNRVQQWKWRSAMDRCEKCRESLLTAKTTRLPKRFEADARAIAYLLSPDPHQRREHLRVLPAPFDRWNPGELLAAALDVGIILSERHPGPIRRQTSIGDFRSFRLDHLFRGFQFLKGWPRTLEAHFSHHKSEKSRNQRRAALGPFMVYFTKAESQSKIEATLREQAPITLKAMDVPGSGKWGMIDKLIAPRGSIDELEASTKYKISKRLLRRLNTEAAKGPIANCARGRLLFDDKLLGASIIVWRNSVGAVEASRCLHVPQHCLPELARRGLLALVADGDAVALANGPLFERASVVGLLQRLSATSVIKCAGAVAALDIMRTRLHPECWANLLQAVLDGTVKRGKQRRRNGPWDFVLEKESAKHFVEMQPKRPLPNGVWITKNEAVSLVGMVPGSFVIFTRSGLIRRNGNTKMHTYFCLNSIQQFNSKYFVSSQSKRLFRLGVISFRNAMARCGFKRADIVLHPRLWYRSEVIAAFPGILAD